ncbi:MAG TPA: DUF364 domain-containing protein [Acidobacteriota bacterium]|nr:DUF364 domain-containing protein [Acidobacteriota bacterium]
MLNDEIYREVLAIAAEHRAMDIRVGLGYTAVALEDGRCGLAYTLHEKEYESCTVIPEAGTLAGRKASELISWIKQPDQTACAIGLATANALISIPKGAAESDILDLLAVGSGNTVGMIGYFGPLVDPLRKRARILHIFERKPIPDLGVLPDSAAGDLLPECQVVVLSATTLLNQTIDGLLDHCMAACEIVILGPSTPFLPGVLSKRGVTVLSGVQVVDTPQVLRVVSEAGGTRKFGSAVRKLTLRLSNSARSD